MRKYLLVIVALISISLTLSAQEKVSYAHKLLSPEECKVTYSVARQDSAFYIYVTIRSSEIVFTPNPIMKIRTFNDDVLDFFGENLSQSTETGGIGIGTPIGNTVVTNVIPYSETKSMARFEITEEQFNSFSQGVKKIRLSTAPLAHEKVFKHDIIGSKLFHMFQVQRNKEDIF